MENSSEISLQDSKFTKVLWRLIVTIGIIFTATNIYRLEDSKYLLYNENIKYQYLDQGSIDRQVRGPTSPNRSESFKFLLALVRSQVSKFFRSWSGTNRFWSVDPWPRYDTVCILHKLWYKVFRVSNSNRCLSRRCFECFRKLSNDNNLPEFDALKTKNRTVSS